MISGRKIVVVDHPSRWSDTPHFCIDALRREVEQLIVVGTLTEEQRLNLAMDVQDRLARLGRIYCPERDPAFLEPRAAAINETLGLHPDAEAVVVFNPPDAAYLKTNIPIVVFHDATWKQFTSTYPGYSENELMETSYRSGVIAERTAFHNARWLLFMSKWAADGASQEYPLLRDKIRVVYPGANLPQVPGASSVQQSIAGRTTGQCRLLFIGYAFYRKGLDIALKTVARLRSLGIDAVLQVVGGEREPATSGSPVRWYGRLSKFVVSEFTSLSQIYLESFILLLPSRAECAGIVLCEAAAFGMPALVPQTGGMSEIVAHGETGYVLPSGATPDAYASAIARLWRDPVSYRKLCENARTRYEELLNWNATVKHLRQLLN
jgi:glycosyltransferase involved in cell wall biosynthesis